MAVFPGAGDEAGTGVTRHFSGGQGLRVASWLEKGVVSVSETHDWMSICCIVEALVQIEAELNLYGLYFTRILTATFQTKRRKREDLVHLGLSLLTCVSGTITILYLP